MKAKYLEKNLYAVYDPETRFIQIVEYDALRARLINLQEELEARREELETQRDEFEALKQHIIAAETPATLEEILQSDWLHTIAYNRDTIRKRVEEIIPEYELAMQMWWAIEQAS